MKIFTPKDEDLKSEFVAGHVAPRADADAGKIPVKVPFPSSLRGEVHMTMSN